jgi:FAD synthetase
LAERKTVLATGVFDILHPGHLRFLEESKRRGGPGARLVVVIARDDTVLRRKGRKPILSENERLEMVSAFRVVDSAVLGHKHLDLIGILREIQPSIVSVGYDQNDIKSSVKKLIEQEKLGIRVVQIRKFSPSALNSSTKLKNRIARSWTPP